jgi:membrane protease YdiL (CAAX protease family)
MFNFDQFKKNDHKYSKLPLTPLKVIVVTIVIYFAAQFLAGVVIAIYPTFQGLSLEDAYEALLESNTVQFAFAFIAQALTFWFIYQYLKRKKISLKSMGWKKPTREDVILAFQGYGVYFLVFVLVFAFIANFVPAIDLEQTQELGFQDDIRGPFLVLVYIAIVIMPSLTEELMVRGFLFTGLRIKLNFLNSAVISSVLFGAAHLQWGGGESLLWMAAVDTTILGFVMAYLREKTGSLAAPIMIHGIKNSVAFALLFVINVS